MESTQKRVLSQKSPTDKLPGPFTNAIKENSGIHARRFANLIGGPQPQIHVGRLHSAAERCKRRSTFLFVSQRGLAVLAWLDSAIDLTDRDIDSQGFRGPYRCESDRAAADIFKRDCLLVNEPESGPVTTPVAA